MRIKQMIINSNLHVSKKKTKILQTCLQVNYRNSLGGFSSMSYGTLRLRGLNLYLAMQKAWQS